MKFLLKATLPPPKMAYLKKFLTFLVKKCYFSENFWDLLGFSQICRKIFKKISLAPTLPPRFLTRLMYFSKKRKREVSKSLIW
jgi:hypothetical protein